MGSQNQDTQRELDLYLLCCLQKNFKAKRIQDRATGKLSVCPIFTTTGKGDIPPEGWKQPPADSARDEYISKYVAVTQKF